MSRMHRPAHAISLLLGFVVLSSVGGSQDAFAAKKHNKKMRSRPAAAADIERVGVQSIDRFFGDARNIDTRLDRAQTARRKGRLGVNAALGLDKGTALKDALRELKVRGKGNLSVVMRGGVPQLKPGSMLPSDLTTAVDAVNRATSGYAAALKDLAGVPRKTASMVKKSRQLPKKLKNHYIDNFNPLEIPQLFQQTRTVKNNIKVMRDMPSRSRQVVKGLNKDIRLLVDTFGGNWQPGRKHAADNRGRR